MIRYLTITPRDPIIARDSRPFGRNQGFRMRSLDWPYPSVLAGSLRTLLGKQQGGRFDASMVEQLKSLAVAGPFPIAEGELYFPHPLDSMAQEKGSLVALHPLRPGEPASGQGCDLPEGLQPVMLSEKVTEDFKPAKQPAFWSAAQMWAWLAHGSCGSVELNDGWTSGFLEGPKKDERTHVSIDKVSGAASESELFSTVGLDFWQKAQEGPLELTVRVGSNNGLTLPRIESLHPLGGERRLVFWREGGTANAAEMWSCLVPLRDKIAQSTRVRLILATPALFAGGWKPGWLSQKPDGLEGCPPRTSVRLRLVGAVVGRWRPISGWSLEAGRRGIKPIRRLVPAGSVYFFELLNGNPATLAQDCWLQPTSDDDQDRRDGFGLSLWGVWEPHP
jgi:CRISPR-associated protein Cmr3